MKLPNALQLWCLSAALLVVLAGCGSGAKATGPSFTNPVYQQDFADPFILQTRKMYYAYATAPVGGGAFVPELRSRDLIHWKDGGDALPIPARWADKFWAPTVVRLKSGTYALYYTGHDPNVGQAGAECIGVGFSTSPAGPFRDLSTKPFLCQVTQGGTIDADAFADGGKLYLYFKNDGNSSGKSTYLWGQQLSPDGKRLVGPRVPLIHNSQGWEQDVVEAPTMWKQNGKYYLFFSGNHWDSLSYGVGYATCQGPLGPCTQAPNNPILQYTSGGCDAEGPGGQTIVTDRQGQTWIGFHAWQGQETNYDAGGKRTLWIDPLDWKNGKPGVVRPTCKAEPGPVT